jgi:RNA polymerase sigma factor (sigma-70 family)
MGDVDEESTRIGSASTRERAAFAAFVDEYQQAVGSYLIYLIGEPPVALALTEETFVCAHHAPLATRRGKELRPWLYRVATRLAHRHLREQRSVRPLGPQPERSIASPASPEAAERALVQSVLLDLQPSERTVLLLCDLQQLPFDEVAAILGVSTERIHERLARARARFRFLYLVHDALASRFPNGHHGYAGHSQTRPR